METSEWPARRPLEKDACLHVDAMRLFASTGTQSRGVENNTYKYGKFDLTKPPTPYHRACIVYNFKSEADVCADLGK